MVNKINFQAQWTPSIDSINPKNQSLAKRIYDFIKRVIFFIPNAILEPIIRRSILASSSLEYKKYFKPHIQDFKDFWYKGSKNPQNLWNKIWNKPHTPNLASELQSTYSPTEIAMTTPDKIPLNGVFLKHKDHENNPNSRVIILLPGSASVYQESAPWQPVTYLAEFLKDSETPYSFLLFNPRGVGESIKGTANSNNLLLDAETAYQLAKEELKVPESKIDIYGLSLGGAQAVDLKVLHPETGGKVLLDRTFSSLDARASLALADSSQFIKNLAIKIMKRFGWEFNNYNALKKIKDEVHVFYHINDDTIPESCNLGKAVSDNNPNPGNIFVHKYNDPLTPMVDWHGVPLTHLHLENDPNHLNNTALLRHIFKTTIMPPAQPPFIQKLTPLELFNAGKIGAEDVPILEAILDNDMGRARTLLVPLSNKNYAANQKNTLLHLALHAKRPLEIIEALLEKRLDLLHEMDSNKLTPLHIAVDIANLDYIKTLLAKGANPNITSDDHLRRSPAEIALRKALKEKDPDLTIVEALFDKTLPITTNPNQIDRYRNTFLYNSIEAGNLKVTRFLLKHGANPNFVDSEGKTSVQLALKKASEELDPNLDILEALFDKTQPIPADPNQSDSYKDTFLHRFVKSKHLKIVQFLLRHGANSNATDSARKTPLHIAIEECLKTADPDLTMLEALFDKTLPVPADPNQTDYIKNTLLHKAVASSNLKVVLFLLNHGADPSLVDFIQKTPLKLFLERVSMEQDPDLSILQALFNKGSPNKTDRAGNTLLHDAVNSRNIKIVQFALDNGVDRTLANSGGITPLQLALNHRSSLINKPANHPDVIAFSKVITLLQ